MKDAWVIKLNCQPEELHDECAALGDNPFSVGKLYDSKGKEVEVPKCEQCGEEKSPVIGMHANAWICLTCAYKDVGD